MPKKIDTAAVKLREELELERSAAKAARDQVAELQAKLSHHLPAVRDAYDALSYCAKLEDFAVGGKHHQGFVATVGPSLQRLEHYLGVLPGKRASEPEPPTG